MGDEVASGGVSSCDDGHQDVRSSAEIFDRCTLYLGVQEDGDEGFLILGICRRCRTTVCRKATAADEKVVRDAGFWMSAGH